jgi:hypothetical protein
LDRSIVFFYEKRTFSTMAFLIEKNQCRKYEKRQFFPPKMAEGSDHNIDEPDA